MLLLPSIPREHQGVGRNKSSYEQSPPPVAMSYSKMAFNDRRQLGRIPHSKEHGISL